MRLLLLHGPGKTASRLKLALLKNKFDPNQIVVLEEGEVWEIKDVVLSLPLLSENRLLILENPPEDLIFAKEQIFDESLTLALWFDHEVSDKKLVMEWVKATGGTVSAFTEEKEVSVFPLLDLLATGDTRAFLQIDKLKNVGFDIYYFITMTSYLLRCLTSTPVNVPSFIKNKLAKQRACFQQEKIANLYRQVLQIEYKLKSGLLESAQAEFLLVNEFLKLRIKV